MTLLVITAALGLAAAVYAHTQTPRFVSTRAGIAAARGILLVVGVAFGYVAATTSVAPDLRWLTFAAGFGAVHVPAALILLMKRARHSPKT
jgi:ABC-type xylose transport system permease subunit